MASAFSSTARRSTRLRDTATATQPAQESPATSTTTISTLQPQLSAPAGGKRKNGAAGNTALQVIKPRKSNFRAAQSHDTTHTTETRKRTAIDVPELEPAKPKKRRLKAGSLKMVREMPYEILLEIFSYDLEPVDLYNLSRANEALHALLLSKNLAPPLWEAAFKRVPDLPSCPPGLILPAYAELTYGRACYFCPSTRSLLTVWRCYVRVCTKCFKETFMDLPKQHITTLGGHVSLTDGPKPLKYTSTKCIRSEYEREVAVMESMANDNTGWAKYVAEVKANLAVREEFHKTMSHRQYSENCQKEKKNNDVRKARKQAIIAKLRELGYKPETIQRTWDWKEKHLDTIPGVRVAKPLNDQDWEKIGPKVIAFCHEHLVKQRADAFATVYKWYLANHLQVAKTAPRAPDLARMEPLRGLIHDSPANQEMTELEFKRHLGKIPELIRTWRESASASLVDLVHQDSKAGMSGSEGAAGRDVSVLNLATTVFMCKGCSQPLFFPALINHHCCIGFSLSVFEEARSQRGALDTVEYNPVIANYAVAIVTALNKDPTTTTANQMDKYNQRIECVRCRKDLRKPRRTFMTWKRAVEHEQDKHIQENEDSCWGGWKMADAEMLQAVLACEKRRLHTGSGQEPEAVVI